MLSFDSVLGASVDYCGSLPFFIESTPQDLYIETRMKCTVKPYLRDFHGSGVGSTQYGSTRGLSSVSLSSKQLTPDLFGEFRSQQGLERLLLNILEVTSHSPINTGV